MKITKLSSDEFSLLPQDQSEEMNQVEQDRKFSEQVAREKRIEKLIRQAFAKCDLGIDDFRSYAVIYDEDGREARVRLNDFRFPLTKLSALTQSGLSNEFFVTASEEALCIEFVVSPEMDRVS